MLKIYCKSQNNQKNCWTYIKIHEKPGVYSKIIFLCTYGLDEYKYGGKYFLLDFCFHKSAENILESY